MDVSGAALARAYHDDLVGPVLAARWPDLPHAAGRLGHGSDVLGYDDEVSQDHDWGLRLDLLVPADLVTQVDAHLDQVLPETFDGRPVRFAATGASHLRHRVQVQDVRAFVVGSTGIDATAPLSVADWLSLTGQAVLQVTAGPVFVDTDGGLTAARERLSWCPYDVWAYVVATDWARLAQELPFVGRTAERGDDLGSRVIAARLVEVAMHLAHTLERRWTPYSKWVGTSMAALPRAGTVAPVLHRVLTASTWQEREAALVEALRALHRLQRDVGLPVVEDPVEPFWERRYQGVRDEVVERLEASITDPAVRALPRGVGSAEQRSATVDVLVDPGGRYPRPRSAVTAVASEASSPTLPAKTT